MNNKLETILLKAKEDVYTHLSGGNLTRILGQGYDFAELREYDASDDIRHISWINSAKLGQPYVKKMHEEKELNVAVCISLDGRFLIGEKRDLALYVQAVLAYSAYEANDLFSSILVTEKAVKYYEPSKNLYAIEKVMEEMVELTLLGSKVDHVKVSNIHLESKHLLFIIGDFLDPIDLSILAQKHELIVIIIRDESEENPKISVESQLVNPQTNQPIHQTISKRAIGYYRSKLLEHDNALIEHFHRYNIRYVKVYKQEEVLMKLEKLF